MSKIFCGNGECGAYLGSMGADSCVHCGWIDPEAIEAAATEPLLQRIAELEEMNAQLREQNTEVDKACAELERQLEEAREDAERYRWLRDLDEDPVLSLAAQYTDMNGSATSISQRIDAAIDAAMQNDKPVGIVFQKGQS